MAVDEADFESWARVHHHQLLGIARVVTGDPTLAQDVLQDCLVDMFQRWDRISGEGSDPLAYAARTMGSKAANHRRTAWGRRVHVTDEAGLLDGRDADPSGSVHDRVVIGAALRQLSPRQRQVVAMHYLLDMSVAEIAAELRRPSGSITSDLTRARQRLRADLSRGGEQPHGG
ncbi:MAG: RNA polymerase sigma factor [Candidatus Nanopelagicales bacterium]|jgi:RNA polymerase sigma-70 factor (ECF subfamily)